MSATIVRAESEEKARQLARSKAYGEGEAVWIDSKFSSCDELFKDGEEEIILCQSID